jgi:hypothetical protein
MNSYTWQSIFNALLWLLALFAGLHLLCTAIFDRIVTRSEWVPLGDDRQTNETGPK